MKEWLDLYARQHPVSGPILKWKVLDQQLLRVGTGWCGSNTYDNALLLSEDRLFILRDSAWTATFPILIQENARKRDGNFVLFSIYYKLSRISINECITIGFSLSYIGITFWLCASCHFFIYGLLEIMKYRYDSHRLPTFDTASLQVKKQLIMDITLRVVCWITVC